MPPLCETPDELTADQVIARNQPLHFLRKGYSLFDACMPQARQSAEARELLDANGDATLAPVIERLEREVKASFDQAVAAILSWKPTPHRRPAEGGATPSEDRP